MNNIHAIPDEALTFFADPGHGWLRVPHWQLKALSIQDSISSFSFQDREYAYLEEDCDAGRYIDVRMKETGEDKFPTPVYTHQERTFIRNLNRY